MPRRHTSAKHERFKSSAPCERKRRFKSEKQALEAIEHAGLLDMSLQLSAYLCPYCGSWHLSSIPQRD
ncbi:MAG: hypothetical protein V4678_03165 [Patescibacteria group bacterium]